MNGSYGSSPLSITLKLLLSLGLLLGLSAAAPARAEQEPLIPVNVQVDLDQGDDTALFVVGNTLFAVYHELGHALIDLLELPVIGREEDAADGFAAVMMIPPIADPIRDELIVAVADGWRLQSDRAGTIGDQGPLWAEHALDEQRYFAVICWMVGSDQEGFFDLAEELGMPVERIEACAGDFERMRAGWEGLLSDHVIGTTDSAHGNQGRIAVVFDNPDQNDAQAFEWARSGEVIERSVLDFGQRIALPEDITVRFRSCGDANAFWYRDRLEVSICYGLVDDFLSVLTGDG